MSVMEAAATPMLTNAIVPISLEVPKDAKPRAPHVVPDGAPVMKPGGAPVMKPGDRPAMKPGRGAGGGLTPEQLEKMRKSGRGGRNRRRAVLRARRRPERQIRRAALPARTHPRRRIRGREHAGAAALGLEAVEMKG